MRAHKLQVTIPEDHDREIAVSLPDDFPAGPAEVIVLADVRQQIQASGDLSLPSDAALARLLSFQPTAEEEKVLDEFESFQRQHPIRLDSLLDEP